MLGLRSRLLILLLFAIVTVLGVSFHSLVKIQRQATEEAQQKAMDLARLLAVNQEHFFEQAHQLLVTISQLPQIRKKDSVACRKLLSGLMEPLYANLGVIGVKGALICSSFPLSVSVNPANQIDFKRALENRDFVIGNYQSASTTGRPILNVAYPIMKTMGKPRRVVFASLDLAWLHQVAASQMPLDGTFNLVDDQGTVLIGHPSSEKAIFARRSMIQNLLRERNGGTVDVSERNDTSRLLAFAPIGGSFKGQKLFVALEIVRSSKTSGIHISLVENLPGLVFVVVLIAAVAWAGGDFLIVRGFHSLLSASRSLASGNLAARVSAPSGGGEVGQLARAFDDLADSLQRRENETKGAVEHMRSQRQRQNALHEINLAITSTLDLSAILTGLLEKIDLLLPYSAATVRLYDRETGRLEPIASRNVEEKEWKGIQWKTGIGLPNVVFDSKAPLVVENAQTDPRTMDPVFFRKHGFISYLGVPLIAKGETLGVLSFYTKKEHQFSPQEVDFLTVLAGQAAIAIHNSQLFVQTRNQAVELEKSNRIKDEFLSVMSHELRTPLNIIMNYTDMLKAEILGEVSDSQGKALEKVSHQSRELLRMVNGILDVARLEAGTVNLEIKRLSLEDFVHSLKSEYSVPLDKDVHLVWNLPPAMPPMETDPLKLKQIVKHLIDNAIKFTDSGTVTTSVRLLPEEGTLEFHICDTGIGIAEDYLAVIFEKFRQIDSSDSRLYGGSGLGLYVAKAYTEMLGGTVEAKSRPGQGSTFTVRLPIQET